jgi:hypothetical protein
MRLIDRLIESIADRVYQRIAWRMREARRQEHLDAALGELSDQIADKLDGLHLTFEPPKPRA